MLYESQRAPIFGDTSAKLNLIRNSILRNTWGADWEESEEVSHIGFVKVHKAASSTLQNILFRFGRNRNLTFVFTTSNNYFSTQSKYHFPLVKPKYRDGYDIHCIHGVFNHTIYSSILPADSIYFAIVRDPLQVFISAVNYYTQPTLHLPYLMRVPGNILQNLIRHSEKYDPSFFSYTKNVMARDLGFPATNSAAETEQYLNQLGTVFKTVLIVEHFDESLILLRRYLQWSIEDILYIPNNVHKQERWSLANLSTSDLDLFQNRNKLDISVYTYFYKQFWRQFAAEGEGIVSEVVHFKNILNKVMIYCTQDPEILREKDQVKEVLVISESEWNPEFSVNLDDCDQMKMEEIPFINLLRKEQGSELQLPVLHKPKGIGRNINTIKRNQTKSRTKVKHKGRRGHLTE